MMKMICNLECKDLILRKEDYDDDTLGFCEACQGMYIGIADDICSGGCECLREESKNGI